MVSCEAGKEYKEMDLGLDRIKLFLSDNNIDYNKIKYIHIAGTNGKGSTAKTISEILIKSGYKTGLYTSPHLIKINERIQINSVCISDKELSVLDKKYIDVSKKYNLTYFEYVTALAFIYFVEQKTDFVVLETGLGGRLDATNIITPIISIITSIDFDHTEILGDSLKQIAFEKAGIIKEKIPVVCGNIPEIAFKEIEKISKQNHADLYCFGKDFKATFIEYNFNKLTQQINYCGLKEKSIFDFSLLGESQVYNLACVLAVCEILKDVLKLDFVVIKNVLKTIKWPARFDVRKLSINNIKSSLIIDGAHNIQAIDNFIKLYKQTDFYKKETKLIFAMMQEKDYKIVIKKLATIFNNVNIVAVDNSRAIDTKELKIEFSKYIDSKNIFVYNSISDFYKQVKNNDICVSVGSFYLAGTILNYIEETNE